MDELVDSYDAWLRCTMPGTAYYLNVKTGARQVEHPLGDDERLRQRRFNVLVAYRAARGEFPVGPGAEAIEGAVGAAQCLTDRLQAEAVALSRGDGAPDHLAPPGANDVFFCDE